MKNFPQLWFYMSIYEEKHNTKIGVHFNNKPNLPGFGVVIDFSMDVPGGIEIAEFDNLEELHNILMSDKNLLNL